jgi:hypothetical protein
MCFKRKTHASWLVPDRFMAIRVLADKPTPWAARGFLQPKALSHSPATWVPRGG